MTALIFAVAGPALIAGAAWPSRIVRPATARQWEKVCWRTVWMPLMPGLVAVSVLLGWAAIEPDDSERLPISVLLLSGLFAAIWLRAVVRACWAVSRLPIRLAAGTVGLWRPRIVISDALVTEVDPRALAAVHAHERVHVRHRDPFRIWLAQLAIDLQWPWPGAPRRFEEWRRVLELARDEEARLGGADGADLAASVLAAARLNVPCANIAGLIEPGDDLRRTNRATARPSSSRLSFGPGQRRTDAHSRVCACSPGGLVLGSARHSCNWPLNRFHDARLLPDPRDVRIRDSVGRVR